MSTSESGVGSNPTARTRCKAKKEIVTEAAMGIFDTTNEWVRPEIRALAQRGNITLEEYKALRCNSWEWEHIHPALTDETLICAIEHNIKNYEDTLAILLVPEMLKRWRAMAESQSKACDEHKSKLDQEYARGRREAIEEAARFLQKVAMPERGDDFLRACASAIVKHEVFRGR